MKVRILDPRIPKRIGEVGEVVDLPDQYARAWGRRGIVEPAEDADEGESLDDLTVAELKELAGDMDIHRADGKDGDPLKADYVRALKGGRYNRRDMRAE